MRATLLWFVVWTIAGGIAPSPAGADSRTTSVLPGVNNSTRDNGKNVLTEGKRRHRRRATLVVICVIIAIGLAVGLGVGLWHRRCDVTSESSESTEHTATTKHPHSTLRRFRKAAVAADSEECSRVGTDVLWEGGSAVDAAIAAMLCTGVHYMHSAGVGGGAFAVVYNATARSEAERVQTFDFRERAPIKASRDMFVNATGKYGISQKGGLAIAVPGEVKGYQEIHAKYGRLPWERLFQPAINMSKRGVPVNKHLVKALKSRADYLEFNAKLKSLYSNPDGKIKKLGDTIKLPELSETLRRISKDANAFYKGSLADDILADLKDSGSIITQEDLSNYTVAIRPYVKADMGAYTLYTMPPPSSGALVQYMFHILKGYNITKDDIATNSSTILLLHRITEAMKYAYAKRSEMGDADFVDVTKLLAQLHSQEYADEIRKNISDDKTFPSVHYGAKFADSEDHGTSHVSVLDEEGNAVSLTSTINLYFGSGVVGSRTGIMFNDEMDDFSTPGLDSAFHVPPSEANFIAPGKRPLSSMVPSVIVDETGQVKMVVGASGGTRIITGTFLVILRALLLGQPLNQAIDEARIHHQLVPNLLRVEPFFSKVYREELEKKGHKFEVSTSSSVVQAILRKGDYIMAASDDRKGGKPDGY